MHFSISARLKVRRQLSDDITHDIPTRTYHGHSLLSVAIVYRTRKIQTFRGALEISLITTTRSP